LKNFGENIPPVVRLHSSENNLVTTAQVCKCGLFYPPIREMHVR
jgi:hypothetical protein